MLICLDCGRVWHPSDTAEWVEDYGKRRQGCFCCGGAVAEAKRCELCGEWTGPDEKYCENCTADIEKRFSQVLHNEFTEDEIDALNVLYEGRRLE